MNKELVKEIIVSGLARHTAQGLGGALTFAGIAPGNGISVDSYATASAGVLIQTGAFLWSAWRKRRRAKKAARNSGV